MRPRRQLTPFLPRSSPDSPPFSPSPAGKLVRLGEADSPSVAVHICDRVLPYLESLQDVSDDAGLPSTVHVIKNEDKGGAILEVAQKLEATHVVLASIPNKPIGEWKTINVCAREEVLPPGASLYVVQSGKKLKTVQSKEQAPAKPVPPPARVFHGTALNKKLPDIQEGGSGVQEEGEAQGGSGAGEGEGEGEGDAGEKEAAAEGGAEGEGAGKAEGGAAEGGGEGAGKNEEGLSALELARRAYAAKAKAAAGAGSGGGGSGGAAAGGAAAGGGGAAAGGPGGGVPPKDRPRKKKPSAGAKARLEKKMAEREGSSGRKVPSDKNPLTRPLQVVEPAEGARRQPFKEFTLEELQAAIEHFWPNHVCGEGSYGVVYKGMIDGQTVAVKQLKNPDVKAALDEIDREMEVQKRIDHPNAVRLVGYCREDRSLVYEFMANGSPPPASPMEVQKRIDHPNAVRLVGYCREDRSLVYEFMANGSLEDRLLCIGGVPPLQWPERCRIAMEIAAGLQHLHTRKPPIVHRDVKPANVLLDDHFTAKLGDVGLARLMGDLAPGHSHVVRKSVIVGTEHYVDPEYLCARRGYLGPKSDVYSFGVVLLQMLVGEVPNLKRIDAMVEKEELTVVLDPRAGEWPPNLALDLANLGLWCAEMDRRDRPDLTEEVIPALMDICEAAADAVVEWEGKQEAQKEKERLEKEKEKAEKEAKEKAEEEKKKKQQAEEEAARKAKEAAAGAGASEAAAAGKKAGAAGAAAAPSNEAAKGGLAVTPVSITLGDKPSEEHHSKISLRLAASVATSAGSRFISAHTPRLAALPASAAFPAAMAAALNRRGFSLARTALPQLRALTTSAQRSAVGKAEAAEVSGIPKEQLQRKVVVYSPARAASQQGMGRHGQWKIRFDTTSKWENPLMGWTSTADPMACVADPADHALSFLLSQLKRDPMAYSALSFHSKQDAVDFVERHGWHYQVLEPQKPIKKPKSYAENFRWKGHPATADK
ncbi:unnamed protein product [Closterium sp. Naga37s-1]|nr:unnamed protein product [Closterium sp. Naga37s-1]